MRAADYQALLERLDGYGLNEAQRQAVIEAVRMDAKERCINLEEGARARLEFARHLLDMRESRQVIRDRLMARFGISTRSAQRDIAAALQMRQKTASNGAKVPETLVNEEVISQEC